MNRFNDPATAENTEHSREVVEFWTFEFFNDMTGQWDMMVPVQGDGEGGCIYPKKQQAIRQAELEKDGGWFTEYRIVQITGLKAQVEFTAAEVAEAIAGAEYS